MNTKWNEFTISAIGDVIGGGTPSTKHDEYYNDEIAWITPKDLSNFKGRYISRGERSISQKGYDNSSAQMMPAGTVLFSSRAPIGYVAIAKNELCTNQGFKSVVPHPEVCDSEFLYYLLCYRKHDIEAIASGTTFMEVSGTALKNFVVRMPDISTQKKIASVLSSLDKRIEGNNLINHNLEEQAKAILDQNCLAHKTLKVGDIVSFANGFAFKSSTYIEKGKFKVVTIKNVQDGKIDTSSADCVHEIPAKMKAECILNIGDVLLSLTGNVGRTGIVCENNLLLNQRVAKIIPHQSVLNAVCYFIFRRPEMKAALETIARGTAQANLSPVETLDIEIPFDIPTLQDIALYMKSFFEQIISNEMEIQTLAQLRDTLLPKLMSGEIDVSEVEV